MEAVFLIDLAELKMKPKPLAIVLTLSCMLFYVSYAVNPACECVVYQSFGRTTGTFTSPNFPQVYAANINCILFTFIGDLDEIVELTFTEFDLQVPITNKCTDFVKFFLDLERPEVNERYTWNYEICGNISMIQKKHYSSTRSLILEFHSDQMQGNHTGFRGIYKFLDKAQYEIVGGNRRWGSDCTYDFYSQKKAKDGRFFSPRYPQNYPPGANCQYVFYGMKHERVRLTFHNIQLETIDGSCSDSPDFVVVRDGMDATAPVIAQYCNTLNGEMVLSSSENLYVEFIVDDKKQRQGFAASFEFVRGEWSSGAGGRGRRPSTPPTRQPVIIPVKDKDINSKMEGDGPKFPIRPTTKKSSTYQPLSGAGPTSCTHSFMSSAQKNGTFSSPRYPNPYPSDTTCKYNFQGQGRERVQIEFTDLDLNYLPGNPKDPYDCEDVDSVIVSVTINDERRDIGVYCGSKLPPVLMSNDNRMEVTFISRTTTNTKGFQAKFKFVEDFGIKQGEQDKERMVCGFIYRSSRGVNGTFTSPNFPGLYPRNTECHYLFHGSDNERIHIRFPYFDVEGIPPACVEDTQSDYVEFSNFNVPLKDRKMSRFCGNRQEYQKKEVHSDGSFFRVTFKSNDVYDATGFEAFYMFQTYDDPFKTPGYNPIIGSVASVPRPSLLQTIIIILTASFMLIKWTLS